jgi:hypothetical protein
VRPLRPPPAATLLRKHWLPIGWGGGSKVWVHGRRTGVGLRTQHLEINYKKPTAPGPGGHQKCAALRARNRGGPTRRFFFARAVFSEDSVHGKSETRPPFDARRVQPKAWSGPAVSRLELRGGKSEFIFSRAIHLVALERSPRNSGWGVRMTSARIRRVDRDERCS